MAEPAVAEPLADLKGTDFTGGAHARYGSTQYGRRHVNYVYAKPTGALASMSATFTVETVPTERVVLHVLGCNQDLGGQCKIAISLNGRALFEGANTYPSASFRWGKHEIPEGLLRSGENVLRIANVEERGNAGNVPWFMVARCVIGPEDLPLDQRPNIAEDFFVTLPEKLEPMPTPLAEGREPGFSLRGTKGWLWTADQYLEELAPLAECGGNFLMICYGSMWNLEQYPEWPERNAWWLPLPQAKRDAYLGLLRACQMRGVELCLAMNPNLSSSRALDYSKPEDLDALWQHYEWFQSKGMKWFSLCLDDISQGIDAAGQAKVVNAIFERLRGNDAEAQMIFCPTAYSGDGSGSSAEYLATLAADLHKDVFLFWTGDAVVTPHITREAAEKYRERCKHRLVIWDNYPVNDGNLTLHLGPVTGRDPDLRDVCYGYMSNPLNTESQINRVPLMTCMDYAYNPWDYDPARSLGQAILHVGETQEQRAVLKDLVELFPGMLVYRKGTGFNPVIDRFETMLDTPHPRHLAELYLAHVESVADRLGAAFSGQFSGAQRTLRRTIEKMQTLCRSVYGADR